MGQPPRAVRARREGRFVSQRKISIDLQLGCLAERTAHRTRHRRDESVHPDVGAGLSHTINGERLLPIATLYDPFIERGLDALNYAAYQDARFMVVATPSGITLAPEGGAHQSIATPLIGMAQDSLRSFEPAFVDELAVIMGWGFRHMQREYNEGGSVYLRLSTARSISRSDHDADLQAGITEGAYWLRKPVAKTPKS